MLKAKDVLDKVPLDKVPQKGELAFIFEGQRGFLSGLARKGKVFPPIAVNLNDKVGQATIRDMGTRFLEEWAEAFEHVLIICKHYTEVPSDTRTRLISDTLLEFNEEISDALHFMINLMIYSGYNAESLAGTYNTFLIQDNMDPIEPGDDVLLKFFQYARYVNIYHEFTPQYMKGRMNQDGDPFSWGGRYINGSILTDLERMNWTITYEVFMLLNKLKIRAWRNDALETKHQEYHLHLLKVWQRFMAALDFMGFCPISLGRIYAVKNHINWDRQNNSNA